MSSRTHWRLAGIALASSALVACYVVPIDPRTGQPLPAYAPPAVTTAVTPPPAAPLQMQARLYPLNDQAHQAGLLLAQVTDHLSGRGSLTLQYRGQWLQGEATRVDAGYAGFGRVHDQVLGPARRDYAGRRGMANAFGGGLSAQCEYVITGPAIGTGACLFSDGAKYQLHFGS
jgi:hypothetical protein